nr:MAG TPA_asm: hypothetical protein [Microviridae sp.]
MRASGIADEYRSVAKIYLSRKTRSGETQINSNFVACVRDCRRVS